MKERKTPADFAREITGAEIEGYRFTGYDITELMRRYADHAVEIARKEERKSWLDKAKSTARMLETAQQEGYENGYKAACEDKGFVAYHLGYNDAIKEERERHTVTRQRRLR